jgi:serine/threonine-protein kinase RsbW
LAACGARAEDRRAPASCLMVSVQTRIPNRLDAMAEVAAMVEAFCKEYGVSRRILNDVNVALDEVLNNVISYAFEPGARSEIGISVEIRGGKIVIDVEDAGRPFDPLGAPPPDLTGGLRERRVGGIGIHFVRNLMDAVEYARVGELNRLRLSKSLTPG